MPQNTFWTNKCLKIGLGQFFDKLVHKNRFGAVLDK